MKKKLAFVLSLCFVMLMLGACGTDPTTVDYNGHSYSELEDYSEGLVEQLSSYGADDLNTIINDSSTDETIKDLVQKWLDNTGDLGSYQGTEDFKIEKAGTTLTTDIIVKFEERNVDFQVVFNYTKMEITGYTVEPVYSLGEKMEKAGLNTVISMSIVFAVLILISLIISCFNIFPYLEKKKKEKAQATAPTGDQVITQIEQREEQQLTDDTELVAVIAAAIAASTGTSTSDFVVRSINRR